MRTYKLAINNISATTNAAAYVTIGRAGKIKGIAWSLYANSKTDASYAQVEASLGNVNQVGTNDTIGPFSEARVGVNFTTSGESQNAINFSDFPDLPVASGERIYLNIHITGTLVLYGSLFLRVEERG